MNKKRVNEFTNRRVIYSQFIEIIELVRRSPPLFGAPFRPTITDQIYDDMNDLNDIMTRCWKEDPTERPDFSILKTTIRKVNK